HQGHGVRGGRRRAPPRRCNLAGRNRRAPRHSLDFNEIAKSCPRQVGPTACRRIRLYVIFPSCSAWGCETMSYGGREAAKAASSETAKITDQVADGVWARVTEWRRDPARLIFAPDGTLTRGLVIGAAVLLTLPTVDYCWRYEGGAANLFFVS